MKNADYWIDTLNLDPHPEGGFYRRTYESNTDLQSNCLPEEFEEPRKLSTAIYYLLDETQVSCFHKLKSDELWHFYFGEPLTIHFLQNENAYSKKILGPDIDNGEQLQIQVPKDTWFGASVKHGYCLAGCTVSPGFSFEDFTAGNTDELIEKYPNHETIIRKLNQ